MYLERTGSKKRNEIKINTNGERMIMKRLIFADKKTYRKGAEAQSKKIINLASWRLGGEINHI